MVDILQSLYLLISDLRGKLHRLKNANIVLCHRYQVAVDKPVDEVLQLQASTPCYRCGVAKKYLCHRIPLLSNSFQSMACGRTFELNYFIVSPNLLQISFFVLVEKCLWNCTP